MGCPILCLCSRLILQTFPDTFPFICTRHLYLCDLKVVCISPKTKDPTQNERVQHILLFINSHCCKVSLSVARILLHNTKLSVYPFQIVTHLPFEVATKTDGSFC